VIVQNIRRKYMMDALLCPKNNERREIGEKVFKNV
jgi:hypothetical protein